MADRVIRLGSGVIQSVGAERTGRNPRGRCAGDPVKTMDRKLLRDLWGMKGQALAIAMVIVSGVATSSSP